MLNFSNECPDRETLANFTLGKLSDPECESIANHLSSCSACEELQEDLDQQSNQDPFIVELRKSFSAESILSEAGCELLEASARALGDKTNRGLFVPEDYWLGKTAANYRILGRIGSGGMGVVFKAVQIPLDRQVALKMIQGGVFAGPKAIRRFQTEGLAISRLQHPNVVSLFDFGEVEGLPFFSMELMEGGSLATKLSHGTMPPREAAMLVATLALGVDYAHNRQVIHRDLKPSNILFSAQGIPKISDFGLAKLADLEEEQTRSGQIMGTPSYMAPEQTNGIITNAVDIYALGVILFESLVGRPPFKIKRPTALSTGVIGTAYPHPPLPSHFNPDLPRDLETICLKCLENDPKSRYASAQALAEDLNRWLNGEPILAKPLWWPRKLGRTIKRHKVAACLCVSLIIVLFASMVILQPENNLPAIEAELAQGKAVSLIEETGNPKWFRVVNGKETTKITKASDGAFSIQTWGCCFLEILADPGQESYRFQIQVRHENASLAGEAGVFFAHQAHPGPVKDFHAAMILGFNDVRSMGDYIDLKKSNLPDPKGNPLRFNPQLYCEIDEKKLLWEKESGVSGITFEPNRMPITQEGRWRDIEVEVTPDQVICLWDKKPVGKMSSLTIQKQFNQAIGSARALRPNESWLQAFSVSYQPRGSLGLYLYRGTASFRNATVTPIKPTTDQ